MLVIKTRTELEFGNAVCLVCEKMGIQDGRALANLVPVPREDDLLCLYVAGQYSDVDVIPILDNMRRGMQWCYKLIQCGPFAPWCPWMDYHYSLIGPMSKEQYYKVGLAWLRKADGVFVTTDPARSPGTRAEITEAERLGIPVFYDWNELMQWADGRIVRGK